MDEAAKSSHLSLNTSHSNVSLLDQQARFMDGFKHRIFFMHLGIKLAHGEASRKRHILEMMVVVFVDVSELNLLTHGCVDTSF